MLLVLSPSKTQVINGKTISKWTLPPLLQHAEELTAILRGMDEKKLGELMRISPPLAAQTYRRFQEMSFPFTPGNSRQALLVFRGAQYTPIEIDRYSEEDFLYAQEHLCMLSGLYGVLRPLDLIQPYRLEMATKLVTGKGRNLYQFWDGLLAKTLRIFMAGHKHPVLVNLASVEYFRAVRVRELGVPVLKIDFKEQKGDATRVIAVHAKRARGLMADWVLRNRIGEIEGLKQFTRAGYQFSKEMSSPWHWVFCRPGQ